MNFLRINLIVLITLFLFTQNIFSIQKKVTNTHKKKVIKKSKKKFYTKKKVFKSKPNLNLNTQINFLHKENFITNKKWVNIIQNPKNNQILFKAAMGTKFFGKKTDTNFIRVKLANNKAGYINKDDLNDLILNNELKQKNIRSNLAKTAKSLLNTPYKWAGNGPSSDNMEEGLDCSGFTSLVYKTNGFNIPRRSKDQYLFSQKINGKDLKTGDLIFSASAKKPKEINHVALYLDNGQIIEAVEGKTIAKTRIIKDNILFKKSLRDIKLGQKVKDKILYFGSILKK